MLFYANILLKLVLKDGLSSMQVILTEEEYLQLKMDAAKASTPDHVALQNCALQTIENFENFAKQALHMYFDTAQFFETISAYKKEIQSHFVR